ncbi:hypothetical protein ACFL3V_01970 [Nanoarchaeota archaeon]
MNAIHTGKKAQLTIFIILGIVILGTALVTLYFIYFDKEDVLSQEIGEAIEEAPAEVKPIDTFIRSCITQVAEEGIYKAGQHGGYIDMLDEDISGREFNIDLFDPTEADGVTFLMDESTHVAYWWHMATKNNCWNCLLSDQNSPSLENIELQMERYISRELERCLDDFRGFEKQGFEVEEKAEPKVDVKIAKEDISIFANYPVNITMDSRTTELDRFYVKIPLKFIEFYELARAITAAEVEENFLEEIIIYLLSSYSSSDSNRLPPFFAREFGASKKVWIRSIVKQNIMDIIGVYTPLIQLKNTKNGRQQYTIEEDPAKQAYYSLFYKDVLETGYDNYTVTFLYFGQPIYLHMNPDGESTGPTEVKVREISMMGLSFGNPTEENIYEYFYDVSVPIIVELRKEDVLFGRPYSFYFALEANIRDNRAIKKWMAGNGTMGPFDRSKMLLNTKAEAMMNEEAANIPHVSGNITKSLFCRPKQRVSGNVTIRSFNSTAENPLDGVQVRFGCGSHRACSIGETTYDLDSDTSELVTQLPICVGGGYLKLSKDGFREKVIAKLTTEVDTELEFDVMLEPLVTKSISLKKFRLNRTVILENEEIERSEIDKWLVWNSTLLEFNGSDQIIMNIRKIDDPSYVQPFTKTLVIYGNASLTDPYFLTVDLVPGIYTIKAQYLDTDGTVFPENCSHICEECTTDNCEKMCRWYPYDYEDRCSEYSALTGVLTAGIWSCHTCGSCDVDVFIPEENITMKPVNLGGIEINESFPWVVSKEDLAGGDTVEFYVLSTPMPRCFNDMNETEEMQVFYESHRAQLNPRFIDSATS